MHLDVYLLPILVLLLPIALASVERTFSIINHIKRKMQNSMEEQLLSDSLVTYLEKDLFFNVSIDSVKTRRKQL